MKLAHSHFLSLFFQRILEGRDCFISFSPLCPNPSQQRIAPSFLILLIWHMPLNDNFHPFLVNTEFAFQKAFECFFFFKKKLNFHLYVIKLCEVWRKLGRNNEPGMLFPLFFCVGTWKTNKQNPNKIPLERKL